MRHRLAILVSLALLFVPAALGLDGSARDPRGEVEERLGAKLAKDQAALVDYVMAFYAVKYGRLGPDAEGSLREAAEAMSAEEYGHAVEKAAMVASSSVARGFLKLGRYGEKALKALVVAAEDAAKDLDRYIQEKALVFDERH